MGDLVHFSDTDCPDNAHGRGRSVPPGHTSNAIKKVIPDSASANPVREFPVSYHHLAALSDARQSSELDPLIYADMESVGGVIDRHLTGIYG